MNVPVSLQQIRIGCILKAPLHDLNDKLLLAAGTELTDRLKQLLLERNVSHVLVSPADLAHLLGESGAASHAAKLMRPIRKESLPGFDQGDDERLFWTKSLSALACYSGPPLQERQAPTKAEKFDVVKAKRLTERFSAATSLVDILSRKVISGTGVAGDQLAGIATAFLDDLITDQDDLLVNAAANASAQQISQRSIKLALLAMCVATELKFSELAVSDVGVCGIVHDWGLYRLRERLLRLDAPFTEDDWYDYKRHPLHTRDMLERVAQIPPGVRLAAYQVHELADGSGYPHGVMGSRIHPFAQILGVCDAYMCFTEQRRGRPPIVPHDAMGCILYNAALGKFAKNVTMALLEVLSLYPLGSQVVLDDGRTARVIRRSRQNPGKPIVEVFSAESDDGAPTTEVIDLSTALSSITGLLPQIRTREMRLPKELMAEIAWDGP